MSSSSPYFKTDISKHIWDAKYRYRNKGKVIDQSIEDTWSRVARALASVEAENPDRWEKEFYRGLEGFGFLPGGRILAGAGTDHKVTLFNCFVMGIIEDTIPSIFEGLKEGALTMQQGGGVGYDFSTLRPEGTVAKSTNNISSGPISFMKIWDVMCATMLSTGARRGAMMATLRCDHPDIMKFIQAKHKPGELTNFNLSVLITDEFMEAVQNDLDWQLVFPVKDIKPDLMDEEHTLFRRWSGTDSPVMCRVFDTVKARFLWNKLTESAYNTAEPGVLFIDRINRLNNLGYCEYITSTNPCGEVPLPPYGACDLGSINLTQFVSEPFSPTASIDMDGIRNITRTGVRILDNVIDLSEFPLPQQKEQAHNTRRIGLGITGLADALIMLGLHYGSEEARSLAGKIMREICNSAYLASTELARQKGSFPLYIEEKFLERPFIQQLPEGIQNEIRKSGIRNSHLLSIAPTGSISILANNVSSGVEPVFDFTYHRKVLDRNGSHNEYEVTDYAYRLWMENFGEDAELSESFIRATELDPGDHLRMQSALQQHVDNSISKTINVPERFPFEQFRDIYLNAYKQNIKGCTTFRPNKLTGSILQSTEREKTDIHCCSIQREGD